MEKGKISRFPISTGKRPIREEILALLSEKYPLNAKEVFHHLKRNGMDGTYQAVHKTMKLMVEEGVLHKQNNRYQIDLGWIQNLRQYTEIVESKYSGKNSEIKLPKNLDKPVTIKYKSLTDFCVSCVKLLASEEVTNGGNHPFYALLDHGLFPLKIRFSDLDLLRKADGPNPNNRVIIVSDTPFDRWISKNYDRIGDWRDKSLIGLKGIDVEEDLIVKNGVIFQIKYSQKTKKFMNDLYPKIRGISDIFSLYFLDKFDEDNLDIEMTISRNPQMAKIIVDKIKSYFGEK